MTWAKLWAKVTFNELLLFLSTDTVHERALLCIVVVEELAPVQLLAEFLAILPGRNPGVFVGTRLVVQREPGEGIL